MADFDVGPGDSVLVCQPSGARRAVVGQDLDSIADDGLVLASKSSTSATATRTASRTRRKRRSVTRSFETPTETTTSPEGTPTSVYFDHLREMNDHFVAILDEADVIEDDTIIHALNDLPGVTVTPIAVDGGDSRVIVEAEQRREFDIDAENHAHPRTDAPVPAWTEGLFGRSGFAGSGSVFRGRIPRDNREDRRCACSPVRTPLL